MNLWRVLEWWLVVSIVASPIIGFAIYNGSRDHE